MGYDIKSRIYISEAVDNRQHRFGQTTEYFPVVVVWEGGDEAPALFTRHQILEAVERARANPEDIPEAKSLWDVIFG